MGKAGVHWFWRAGVAVAAGWVFAVLLGGAYHGLMQRLWSIFFPLPGWLHEWWLPQGSHELNKPVAMFLFWVGPTIIVTVLTFVAMTYWSRSTMGRETRCRKCGYILRGITEPRCPECGERI